MTERKLFITLLQNCTNPDGRVIARRWPEFVELCRSKARRTQETQAEFIAMSSTQQTRTKDIGGFVGGECRNGHRAKDDIISRDLATVDIDAAPPDILETWRAAYSDAAAVVYSTHKHRPDAPKYRIIMPLSRAVSGAEYTIIIRAISDRLGLRGVPGYDPAHETPAQMMFWPSCSADGDPVFKVYEGEALDVDNILTADRPPAPIKDIDPDADGQEVTQATPPDAQRGEVTPSGTTDARGRPCGEPFKKPYDIPGLHGLFCRAYYPIDKAIAKFNLPYIKESPDRYTYAGSEGARGAVIYDGGQYLFSFHGHDPARKKLLDAYDLVHTHVYAAAPAVAEAKKKAISDAAHVAAMAENGGDKSAEFIAAMRQTRDAFADLWTKSEKLLLSDIKSVDWIRYDIGAARATTGEPPAQLTAEQAERAQALGALELALDGLTDAGEYPAKPGNIDKILQLHPDLKNLLQWDDFAKRITLSRAPEWRTLDAGDPAIKDRDDAQIRGIFESYGIIAKDRIYDAITREAQRLKVHPVREYLDGLKWDGQPRIDTALSDFFGGEPTEYARAISRLFFLAAVMRIYRPGCKYDYMLTVKGRQGCGKSTFFQRLGGAWFSDNVGDISNKDAQEGLQGVWIVEFSEMAALRKADAEQMKSFVSRPCDRFRAAYGRRTEDYPRQCVFAATTNEAGFLHDRTGNRRFLVFEAGDAPRLSVWDDLTPEYRGQLFAEAVAAVKAENFNPPLFLPPDIEAQARQVQEAYLQADPMAEQIEQYLSLSMPAKWGTMTKDARRIWVRGAVSNGTDAGDDGHPVTLVCARQIWLEALGHLESDNYTRQDAVNITRILDNMPNWERVRGRDGKSKPVRVPMYGLVKAFRRVN